MIDIENTKKNSFELNQGRRPDQHRYTTEVEDLDGMSKSSVASNTGSYIHKIRNSRVLTAEQKAYYRNLATPRTAIKDKEEYSPHL
jgi:hypothetical protein